MYARLITSRVSEALTDTPVVLITGPRRSGKTTLVRQWVESGWRYLTLDDQTVLDAARSDPVGFIRTLDRVVIDEIQRVPELMLAIKKTVDEDYRPGRFLLTGSANVLMLPRVADSLAGRIEPLSLLPLSQAEIQGGRGDCLTYLFGPTPMAIPLGVVSVGTDLVSRVLTGGYPEVLARKSETRRHDWCRAYIDAVLSRDLRELAEIGKLDSLPRFTQMLADYNGQLINHSQLGAGIQVSYKTSQRYVSLLEQVFLIRSLPPWCSNTLKRLTKTPKLHFLDTALLATVRGLTEARLMDHRVAFGALLETFVYTEVLKLLAASHLRCRVFHYRDASQREVDLVLERDNGQIVGIEIKASASVRAQDFSGLKSLAEGVGSRFASGIVLYDGTEVVPFGERLFAVPLSALWA